MKAFFCCVLFIMLNGCVIGNVPFEWNLDSMVGTTARIVAPTSNEDSGDLIRSDYLISGKGFTHISKNENGDIVQHWFYSEVLPTHSRKDWVGKCKIIYVVDSKTYIIKSWDYDKGANPESCRHW